MTIEELKALGVNTEEGLERCMGKEVFYFKMIKMGLSNECFDTLGKNLADGDLAAAFEAAHALKGVLGNLALTPLYEPIAEITELLRAKKDADYEEMYKPVAKLREKMLASF